MIHDAQEYASVFAGLMGAYSNLIIRSKATYGTPEVNCAAYEKAYGDWYPQKSHADQRFKTMRDFTDLYVSELSEIQDLLKNK